MKIVRPFEKFRIVCATSVRPRVKLRVVCATSDAGKMGFEPIFGKNQDQNLDFAKIACRSCDLCDLKLHSPIGFLSTLLINSRSKGRQNVWKKVLEKSRIGRTIRTITELI